MSSESNPVFLEYASSVRRPIFRIRILFEGFTGLIVLMRNRVILQNEAGLSPALCNAYIIMVMCKADNVID